MNIKLTLFGFAIFLIGAVAFYFVSFSPGGMFYQKTDYKTLIVIIFGALALFLIFLGPVNKLIDKYFKK